MRQGRGCGCRAAEASGSCEEPRQIPAINSYCVVEYHYYTMI